MQVRTLAAAAGLATQARKDSQGICFLGKVGCCCNTLPVRCGTAQPLRTRGQVKFPEFVKEHLGEWQGLIVEEEVYDSSRDAEQRTHWFQGLPKPKNQSQARPAVFGGRRVLGIHTGK
jgi:hypothetical protein